MADRIRVYLLDDHDVVREGLRFLLERTEDIEVVGESATAAEATTRIPALRPDVAVLDARLPDGSGIEVCRAVRAVDPSIKALILTSYDDDEALFAAIMAGASGYVLKEIRSSDLVGAIRTVAGGQSLIDPALTARVLDRVRNGPATAPELADLTDQELKLLALIAEGLTNRQIGEQMFLAEKTVKNYVSNILAKLGLERRTQAAVLAAKLLAPPPWELTLPGSGPSTFVSRGLLPCPARSHPVSLGSEALSRLRKVAVMTVAHERHISTPTEGHGGPTASSSFDTPQERLSIPTRRVLAVLRIGFGLTFLWAFFDKLLALGFGTGYNEAGKLDRFGDAAWINGGSPTEGFLKFGADGPFKDFYNSIGGTPFADWGFMLGLLAIGVALTLGAGVRLAAAGGAVMYLLMWTVVLPPENNPVIDDHLLGAVTLVALALLNAGNTWGLGHWWSHTATVERIPLLR